MIPFQSILWISYFTIGLISYPYLRNAYFPQFPSRLESFIMMVLALVWIVSVPTTMIMKSNEDDVSMQMSYDGFVGREA